MPVPGAPALELDGIVKTFGNVRALDGASLSVAEGEIHALLGENGAGKSTLVAVAAGLQRPDAGRLVRDGREVRFHSAREARAAGVALVPQHDLLIGAATVADNLALLDPRAPRFESRRARRTRAERLAVELGLDLGSPEALAATLPVGTRQRVEIAGALLAAPRILILDEPTAVLAPDETAALFRALRRRADAGASVVVITHRIAEVFAAADRLTLLSRGRTLLACRVDATRPEDVAALLVGGAETRDAGSPGASAPVRGEPRGDGHEAMSSRTGATAGLALVGLHPRGLAASVDLKIAPGELVTLLSIDGNGADEIAAAAAGLAPATGTIRVGGRPVKPGSFRAFRAAGGRYVPADRRKEGVIAAFTIAENLALDEAGGFLLEPARLRARAEERIAAFGIRADGPDTRAAHLSGGNQQKLVLARELAGPARALVAVHPTRGLDLASSADVRRRIASARLAGTAVLVVSAEPEDALAFDGAVRVVYRGRVGGESRHLSLPELGARMAGLPA